MNKIPDPCLFESSLLHPYACHQQRGTQRKPLRIGLSCTLLKLKSFQSKRYLKGIPFSPSLQASVSMAKYIRLRDVKALINSISHREWIRKLAIILDPCKHTIVKLLHHCYELVWTAKVYHNSPKSIKTYFVKCFGKVEKVM